MAKNSSEVIIFQKDVDKVTAYIESLWPMMIRTHKQDLRSLIGLPNPYIVPSDSELFQEQYYWDSYPIVRALINHPKYSKVAIGMVDNFLHLVDRFGIVPNASRYYFLSRSQHPLLSSMVWIVYEKTNDKKWLKNAIKRVELEYNDVWMGKIHLRNYRLTDTGLSRYYDINALDVLAETESGWDMTSRFGGECMNYCPVDLNSVLYLYEHDLYKAYELLGDLEKAKKYKKSGIERAEKVNQYMWNETAGYYFDYNFVKKRRSPLITVAGVYPLNVGLATKKQASRIVKVIDRLLVKDYGIVQSVRFVENKQWDWPNGWAPIQLRIVEGLMRYGYNRMARKLILKWLSVNIKVFKGTGKLWEKYDVVRGAVGVPDRYPTPSGFGWTNAVFLIMVDILKQLGDNPHDNATPIWMVRGLGWR